MKGGLIMVILHEFARSASEIRAQLLDKTPITVEHITYLCIDPDNVNRAHWVSEIHAFINTIGMLKSTKKFPTKDFIYKASYGDSRDMFTNETFMTKFIKSVIKKERFNTDASIPEIMHTVDSACVDYFTWLSDELSKTGFVDIDEVQEKLDSLIPKST